MSSADVLEQLPVVIASTPMQYAFKTDFDSAFSSAATQFSSTRQMEKTLDLLTECVDAHGQELYRWNRYQQNIARQQQAIQHHQYKRVCSLIYILFFDYLCTDHICAENGKPASRRRRTRTAAGGGYHSTVQAVH